MTVPRIARNAFLNFLGMLLPLALAVLLAPTIIHAFGVDRFGILALIWGVFSYFALMDFGLGRALTHAVSIRLSTKREGEIPSALSQSLVLITLLCFILTLLALLIAPSLVDNILSIPPEHRDETLASFQLLAGALSLIATSSALNGYLAAFERFDLINAVKIPLMAGTLCAPLFAIGHPEPILLSTALMVLVRLLGWLALLVVCRAVVPSSISSGRERVSGFRELLSFGGWISLINVANTLFTYADRWALGIWASLAAVTYYTVPFEVATKLWIIPAAIAGAIFPSFCRVSGRASLRESRTLLVFGTGYTMTLLFIPTIALVVFAEEVLIVWLGHEFGQHSTTVFQILLIGTFVNSLAHTSVTLLQGRGRPQWIAFLLLAELPLFLIALWIFVPMLGGKGAALVWTVRVAIDAGVLCFLASRCVNEGVRALSALGAPLVVFLSALIFGATLTSLAAKLLFCGVGIILFSAAIFQLSYWARVQGESPA